MDEELLCEAVQLGADGFMHKDVSSDELLTAIRMVLNGEPWFGQNLSQLVYRSFCRKVKEVSETSLLSTISERELEVIKLLGEGLAIKEIGDKLFISPRTVETHKKNLLEKLGLNNTVALIKYGIRHRIINI
jgi:DNA-binding NarL/FixJ family response regulator